MASWCSGIINALGALDSGSIPEEAHLFQIFHRFIHFSQCTVKQMIFCLRCFGLNIAHHFDHF